MSSASTKPDIIATNAALMARLKRRAAILANIRRFFDAQGFCEVETPLAIKSPAPEEFIESIPAGELFLRPSPELQMKIMLAAGWSKIYQLGACFRAGEFGIKHRPEFTMLEWYEAGADYRTLMDFTTQLLRAAAETPTVTWQGVKIDFSLPPEIITVNDAFIRHAGVTAQQAIEMDNFDILMVNEIEPKLGAGRITYLKDYPASRAALAKLSASNPDCAERWELYLAGVEIANAYSELTNPEEQIARFNTATAYRKLQGMTSYPPQTEFITAIRAGMPESAGCALGIDRLIMILSDAADIADVKIPLT